MYCVTVLNGRGSSRKWNKFDWALWRLAALFPFDWSIKSALPLSKPRTHYRKIIFREPSCLPRAVCCEEFPLHFGEGGPRERESGGNISSRFIERSINRSLLPLTLWPLLTPWTSCYRPGKLDIEPQILLPEKENNVSFGFWFVRLLTAGPLLYFLLRAPLALKLHRA